MMLELMIGFFIFVVIVTVFALLAFLIFGIRVEVVSEEQRLVIYRMGKFQRIAGPGLVWTMGMDTVEHEINVRDQPRDIRIDNLFMFGIPFGYTLHFWYRFDPTAAAGKDQTVLAHLAQFSDRERERLVKAKVRDALVHAAAYVEGKYKAAGDGFFYKLIPVLPGLPNGDELLGYAKEELARTLPSIGVILNRKHPFIVNNLHLADDVIGSFSRGRIVQMLREQFPDLSQDVIMQYASAVEQIGAPHQRLVLENNSAMDAAVDMRPDAEGAHPRVKTYAQRTRNNGATTGKSNPTTTAPEQASLSAADWSVLKQVPILPGYQHSVA